MYKIAIVGKPNVGKSTLFNRLTSTKRSITLNEKGTTRDRIEADVNWLNKHFLLTDTGGLVTEKKLPFQKEIETQVKYAIDNSDAIIFLTSYAEGINPDDKYIAKILMKKNKAGTPIILVVNKSEKYSNTKTNEFVNLGFGKPFYISAEHGIGVGDLLDFIVKNIKNPNPQEASEDSFCIVGKTNVGKSTLMNAILGQERVVTSPIEHTTRDAVDETFIRNGKKYTIIDTAGIRRIGHIKDAAEKFSVVRTEQAIERSKKILLVIDGSKPITEQDEAIGGIAYKPNIPIVIVVNKWDAVEKGDLTMVHMKKEIAKRFAYLSFAPIVFISAKDNKRIHTIFEAFDRIDEELKIKVNNSLLNDVIQKAQINNPAPRNAGGRIKVSYATQVNGQVPTFVLFCNNPEFLYHNFARYIENQIRKSFGIDCVPILVYYKDKNARIRT